MRFRSIVVAVAAILALGGLSVYAASSHSLATATTQGPLHADSTDLQATATPIPIVSFLPRVSTSLPLTNTTTTTTTTATTTVAQQAETCETAEPAEAAETGEDAAEATEPAETAETADQDTGENATTEEDNDQAEAACTPPSAACVDALAALKALQTADRTEDAAEVKPTTDATRDADKIEDAAEKLAKRTAMQAVIAACGHGEHGD
ncbi:MAG: hypothetical protein E6J01_12000 [Chloroflexi bacterium]|nr:MAG: hypothetical protein E6J01_12000 [Chloroflexota bacterium]